MITNPITDKVKDALLRSICQEKGTQWFVRGPDYNYLVKVVNGAFVVDMGELGKITLQLEKIYWEAPRIQLPEGKRWGFCNDTGCGPCNQLVPTHVVDGDCPGVARCIGCGNIPYPAEAGKLVCACLLATGDGPTFAR
jgi:hypothetical protein